MPYDFPEGRYRVKPCGQQFTESSTGNTTFELRFFVIGKYDIERPEELTDVPHEQRTYFRALTDKTIDYFIEDMRSLGFDGRSASELDPEHPTPHLFTDEFDAVCTIESYEGKRRERWQVSRARNVKPADKASLRKLDKLFGDKWKAGAKSAAKPATASVTSPDDTPF